MIIKTEKLKQVASKILTAVDANQLSILTETLELVTKNNALYMNVTNREYYAQIKLDLDQVEDFHATVNANVFLKLIAQTTVEDIELSLSSNALLVKGNGSYTIPLIFENEKLLELPKIDIINKTAEFNINSDILNSILTYNSKELTRGLIAKPVQKLYYVDDQGAITFTTGACVNSFVLPQPVKLLLNARLVSLFKLFQNTDVTFTLGHDLVSDDLIQTKVQFETSDIKLTAIICSDTTMLNSVPATAIRNRANKLYDYSVMLDKNILSQAISRLLLFNNLGKEAIKAYSTFEFNFDNLVIWDVNKTNKETIIYANNSTINNTYSAVLDLTDLKSVLDTCTDQYITLNFGDNQAFVLSRANIKNVIPECRVV